jgi:DNA-binding NarL/FixJ family response regulator
VWADNDSLGVFISEIDGCSQMGVVRIIAADDHQMFLEGLASLFQNDPTCDLVCRCSDGDQLQLAVENQPADIVLLDLSMPGPSSEELITWLNDGYPDIHIIALTMYSNSQYAQDLLTLGLSAYVLKDSAFDDLHLAITEVCDGGQFLSPALLESLRLPDADSALTKRELEVLSRAAHGLANKEIAHALDISERTARFHLANCCIKLHAHGRSHAVAKAIQLGIIKI